jgi:PAS domain S-box-containing protein
MLLSGRLKCLVVTCKKFTYGRDIQNWVNNPNAIGGDSGMLSNQYKKILTKSKIIEFMDCIDNPVILIDSKGKVVYGNGVKWDGLDLTDTRKFISFDLIKDGSSFLEISFQSPKGELLTRVSRRIILDKKIFYLEFIKLVSNKTNISNSNKYLSLILNMLNEGILFFDEMGFCKFINETYCKLTGIIFDDLLGRHISEIIDGNYIDHSVFLEVLKTRRPSSILQRVKKNPNWLVNGLPVFNENGVFCGSINTVYDMTELNQLKEKLNKQALVINQQKNELQILQSQIKKIPGVIAESYEMKSIISSVQRLATVNTTVLLLGETGTGKSMIAKRIHKLSDRSDKNFIEVNCSTIPEHLFESELFGYEKGSFTGAVYSGKKGLIEVANQGTLFLDEIGDLSLNLQVKLLTFLQERKFRPIGGLNEIEVDVRIIAATNKDPLKLISEKQLREDLYYRLSVISIEIPPLRKRKKDIFALSSYYLNEFNQKHNRNHRLSKETLISLENYHWPGNIRELENTIEQLVVLTDHNINEIKDIPLNILGKEPIIKSGHNHLKNIIDNVERQVIKNKLKEHNDINIVAFELGIHRTTLVRKMNKLGIFVKNIYV